MLERDFKIFPRDSLVLDIHFPHATGSMCVHGFTLLNASTHNLKQIISTIRLLLRQTGVVPSTKPVGGGISVVCLTRMSRYRSKRRSWLVPLLPTWFTDELKVTGYITFKVYDSASDNSVKYYANEYMNGQKRYDYAMIEFVSDDDTIDTCPAMILGFVQYNRNLQVKKS